MDETVVFFGSEVKALGDDRVGGYLVRFSTQDDPDLTRDFFTKATDFDCTYPKATNIYYHHGLDKTVGKKTLGVGEIKRVDDIGVWVEAQLDIRDRYAKAVMALAKAGKLGWSSGTVPTLVERKAVGNSYEILKWPLGIDASLTPTPMEPRTQAASIKSLEVSELEVPDEEIKSVETEEVDEFKASLASGLGLLEQGELVASANQHYAKRLENRVTFKQEVKAGRVLSTANCEMVDDSIASIDSLVSELSNVKARLVELRKAAEPKAKEGIKGLSIAQRMELLDLL